MSPKPVSLATPKREQMLLPMLDVIREMGGEAAPDDVIEQLEARFAVPEEVKSRRVVYHYEKWGSRERSPWRQALHWVRLDGVHRGYIDNRERGVWTLTERGDDALVNCKPGIILIVYETPNGQAVWADAITASAHLGSDTVNLIFQSPPYPVLTGRQYGTFTESELIELIMKCAPGWKRALKSDGSMVLNLKDCWLPSGVTGGAARSIYIDKLVCALVEEAGYFLADRHWWRNPSCAPTTPWVTIRKVRAGSDIEHMLWFSKTANPYADATQVLEEAKASTMQTYLAKARRNQANRVCESGHNNVFEEQVAKAMRGEPINVLPRTMQVFANSSPQVALKKKLAEAGLPSHPARMPLELAKWWIQFLTRRGDRVHDSFGGSLTTGVAAEALGRQWSCSERSLAYLLGSQFRFTETTFADKVASG